MDFYPGEVALPRRRGEPVVFRAGDYKAKKKKENGTVDSATASEGSHLGRGRATGRFISPKPEHASQKND